MADVARALGQSSATASKLCSGAQRPDARQAEALAALLGLDAWALMLRAGIVPPAALDLLQRDPEASAKALRELAGEGSVAALAPDARGLRLRAEPGVSCHHGRRLRPPRARTARPDPRGAAEAPMNAPARPLRASLYAVGARRRAELARTTPAPVPATPAPVDRRTALRETVGALRSRVVGHPHGKARDMLVAELVAAELELAQINAAAKASGLVKVGPPRAIITALLEILDRAQNEGFVRTDGEHGQMNEAATWLEEHGGGER